MTSSVLNIVVAAVLALAAAVPVASAQSGTADVRPFDAAAAEHLMNRAGFGGTPEEAERLARLGREAAVDEFLRSGDVEPPPFELVDVREAARADLRERRGRLGVDERRNYGDRMRRREADGLLALRAAWVDRMIRSPSPLAEKATLFWSGHFTSSQKDVRNPAFMARQHATLRRHALGSFRTLLHEVASDPAMLVYLDGAQNRRGGPNENFAREVMELFTLGLGAYGEKDVTEAARAFTGRRTFEGAFEANPRQHDFEDKTILGETGPWTGGDVLEILLRQEAAPRFLARRLLGFFATADPPAEVVARTAASLRRHDWSLRPVLRELFLDPWFDGPEVRGSRILGPIECGVALARRLPDPKPPGALVACAGDALGQALFAPPNVKGWEGGEAWITTSSLLVRGELALALVEGTDAVKSDLFRRPSPDFAGAAGPSPAHRPAYDLAGLAATAGIRSAEAAVDWCCDRLLGVPVSEESRAALRDYAASTYGEQAPLRRDAATNRFLLRLARLAASLPEAQLG